jgi:hypothetical protein
MSSTLQTFEKQLVKDLTTAALQISRGASPLRDVVATWPRRVLAAGGNPLVTAPY